MKEYCKIPAIFQRGEDKKLIEGKYISTTIESLKDMCWTFSEKIDGTNIRIHWDGHKVEYGGRTDNAQIPASIINKLNDYFWGDTNEEIFEQLFGEKDVILFGEGYGHGIQEPVGSKYIADNTDFILFDVLVEEKYFLNRTMVDKIAKQFGVKAVPEILVGKLEDGVEYVKQHNKSTIGNCEMEGLVARPFEEFRDNAGERIIVKIKARDFKKEG